MPKKRVSTKRAPAKRSAVQRTASTTRSVKKTTALKGKVATKAVATKAAVKKGAKPAPAKKSPTDRSAARAISALNPARTTSVVLRTPHGDVPIEWPAADDPAAKEMQRRAMEWANIVRNRRRWVKRGDTDDVQARDANAFLNAAGVSDAALRVLANAARVEVVIPYEQEQQGWEARLLPWEFLLSSATRRLRNAPLTVTRHLARKGKAAATRPLTMRSLLYVECAPGKLAEEFSFAAERDLVASSVPSGGVFTALKNPTGEELRAVVRRRAPDVIHIAGFDTHQGLALLDDDAARTVYDGVLLAGRERPVDTLSALDLAKIVAAGSSAPALVVFNVWNSASRLAPMMIAHGAGAAIGFQDSFDDALAELFCGTFYRELSLSSHNLESAMAKAFDALRSQPKSMRGTGIALWTAAPLVHRGDQRTAARTGTAAETKRRSDADALIINSERISADDLSKLFSLTVKPIPSINYSLLHNDRAVFTEFSIRKLQPGRVEGLSVNVELNVGEGTYPYRRTFAMSDPVLDLSSLVRIALNTEHARSVDEVMRTSLFVEVAWGVGERRRIVFSDTFSVTLAPVDQWTDTDQDRLWLPSFVLPRDAAVRQIVQSAQRYVTVLRDDPGAGFDGYQCIDPDADDPTVDVDRQVQSLWYAVMHDVGLSYINPPPTYAVASQRLRTPSEVLNGKCGTCIDLALLLAACLEYVEIYPVLFLLSNHAFPGYWRSEEARDSFIERVTQQNEAGDTDSRSAATQRQSEPWYFEKSLFRDIQAAIEVGDLVPLETVGLTRRDGFDVSANEARAYFEDRENFDSMLDVRLARESRVTPIPLPVAMRN